MLTALGSLAAAEGDTRARINYMIHCQGCHLPGAAGFPGKVPPMNNFLGWFTHSEDGRRYLAQVPGVASSSLPDEELAELLNWMLQSLSGEQVAPRFEPYTASEVEALRQNQEADPERRRRQILETLVARGVPVPSIDY